MSSKTKITSTKEKAKPALLPKLRFQEFRGAKGWDADALAEVADFVNEKTPLERVALENYVSTENILPEYSGVARASKLPTTGSVTRYRPNDTLVSNIRPYLKKVWVADKEGGASNDVIVIRAKQKLLPHYFSCLLKNDAFINYVMTGAKGVKMPRGDVGSMKAYPTLYPSKPEQQKIAECLSSVDELMIAQARKVDELKTHKKGLMQQLFPREGETQPRLRFPEFQNAGEWSEEKLTAIAKTTIGLVTTMTTSYASKGVPLIRNSDIKENTVRKEKLIYLLESFADKYPSKKLIEGDIVTVHTGDIGVSAVIDRDLSGCLGFATLNTRLINRDVVPEYLCWYFNSERYIRFALSMATGDGRNNFNLSDFNLSVIPISSKAEQKRIASCLNNLDALITAETQRLEALKTHKKGLMQQLFPSLDKAGA